MYWSPVLPEDAIRVTYRLPDGKVLPPEELYCCIQCSALLSRWKLIDEIDSYFCTQCVECLPSTEAMTYRTCCFRCFDCPRCQNVLTYVSSRSDAQRDKATESQLQECKSKTPPSKSKAVSKKDETAGQKVVCNDSNKPDDEPSDGSTSALPEVGFRLVCQFCQWNSSHLNLPNAKLDQLIASLNKAHRETSEAQRLSMLSDALMKSAVDSQKSRLDNTRSTVTIDQRTDRHLSCGDGFNFLRPNKSNRRDSWKATQSLLDTKQNRIKTFSVWDLQVPGLMDLLDRDGETPGLRIFAQELLDMSKQSSAQMLARLKTSIEITDLKNVPTQEQRLVAGRRDPLLHVDQLLPTPKPLLTKRSRRCGTCKRYLVRTQLNPNAPFRLNNSAINFLPRIVIIGLHSLTPLDFIFPPNLESRFPRLKAGEEAFLEFEFSNTLDGIAVNLKFDFSSAPDDTIEITTSGFETTVAGYDELLDEGDSSARIEVLQSSENQAIRHRQQHCLRFRFQVKVNPATPPNSIAKCSFKLQFTPTTTLGPLSLEPVFVLGRTQ